MAQGNHTILTILNVSGYYIQLPHFFNFLKLLAQPFTIHVEAIISQPKKTKQNLFFVSKISSCRLKNLYITLFTIFTLLKLSKFTLTLKNTIDTPCSPYSKQNLARNFRVSQPQLCNLRNGIETLKPCIGWFLYDTSPH